jgi:hypothetical protein
VEARPSPGADTAFIQLTKLWPLRRAGVVERDGMVYVHSGSARAPARRAEAARDEPVALDGPVAGRTRRLRATALDAVQGGLKEARPSPAAAGP